MPVRNSRPPCRIAILFPVLARLLFCGLVLAAISLTQAAAVLAQSPQEAMPDESRLIERLQAFIQNVQSPVDAATPLRCATPALLPAMQARSSLSIAARRLLAPYVTRPSQPGEGTISGGLGHSYTTSPAFYLSSGGHFKVWYVTAGSDRPGAGRTDPSDANANSIPDWVEQCADFFEQSWKTEIDTLGFHAPAVDFQYHAQYVSQGLDDGGDARFDVYIEDLGTGIAGYTVPEVVISGRKLPAYIVVDNDFAGVKNTLAGAIDLLSVTAAHEFLHAVQFNYDADEDIYWFEQTAVWMEEQVFPQVNDYVSYLGPFSGFLTQPWVSLDAENGQHEFAGAIWPLYLSQRFDRVIIRKAWEKAETVQSLDAIDQTLQQSYSSSLKSAFQEFTVWNVFTGARADTTQYYYEGNLYPAVAADTVRSYPASGLSSSTKSPGHLAANYLFFVPDDALPGGLHVGFTGSTAGATGDWGVAVVGVSSTKADTIVTLSVSAQRGEANIYDWGDYDVIILIPAALNRTGFSYRYSYEAAYDPSLTHRLPPDDYALSNAPNPFNAGTTIRYDLPASGRVVITIYNLLGQEVRTLLDLPQPVGRHQKPWDGKDASGRKVASGVYFYQLIITDATGSERRITKKMMLVK